MGEALAAELLDCVEGSGVGAGHLAAIRAASCAGCRPGFSQPPCMAAGSSAWALHVNHWAGALGKDLMAWRRETLGT